MQADALTQIILPLSLFIIMLGMGLALRIADFLYVFKAPRAMVLGLACQLLLLPVLAVFIIALTGLEAELAVGLLVISLCPGGTTSNIISYFARGDVALSISLTSIASVITPFTIPVFSAYAIQYYMGENEIFDLPLLKTIAQLIIITIIPVGIGMLIQHKKPNWAQRAEKPIKILSIAFLFFIIAGIVIKNKASMLGFFVETGVAALLLNTVAMALGFFIAKMNHLSKSQSITLGIEVGIQNGTLALLITSTLLENPMMSIPAVTYSLLMFLTGALFGWLVNRGRLLKKSLD